MDTGVSRSVPALRAQGGGRAGRRGTSSTQIARLQTIVDLSAAGCGSGSPCIDRIFGPTATDAFYWSSSSNAANPTNAWLVRFDDGLVANGVKSFLRPVRAVRGGR
jgi:hypothetical protein